MVERVGEIDAKISEPRVQGNVLSRQTTVRGNILSRWAGTRNLPSVTRPAQSARTALETRRDTRSGADDSTSLSPLSQRDQYADLPDGLNNYVNSLAARADRNSPGQTTDIPREIASLLDKSIPESQRSLISDALRTIPKEHLSMLNEDNVEITVEEKTKQYAHYRKKNSTIYLSDELMRDLQNPTKKKDAERAIRHEIGHATIDSIVSRRGPEAEKFLTYLDRENESESWERKVGDHKKKRGNRQFKVNDELEEKLAHTYEDLFSPYAEDKLRLRPQDRDEVEVWSRSLGKKGAQPGPISALDDEFGRSSFFPQAVRSRLQGIMTAARELFELIQLYLKQAEEDDDPWGVLAR